MKAPTLKAVDIEDLVINDLKKAANIIMRVLDEDSEKLDLMKDTTVLPAINMNIRTLAAINEVLLYYGSAGIFDDAGDPPIENA